MAINSSLKLNDSYTHNIANANLTTEDTDIQTIYEASEWLWKIISPLLFIVGLVGNIGILITLHRLKFWRNQTYTYLYILAITNTLVLMFGLPRHWAIAVFHVDIRDKTGSAGCIIQLFGIYFSMHLSSWTLVCVTTTRFLKIRFPFRFRARDFSKTTIVGYVITVVLCIGLDLHFFFTNGIVLEDGQYVCSNTAKKYYIFEEKYFVVIDLVFLSFIPFTLMLFMDIIIGQVLYKAMAFRKISIADKEQLRRRNRQSMGLTKMLFFTSIYFLMTTIPISIVNILHSFLTSKLSLRGQANLEIARTILYLFQFSYYASNFYIFMEVNKEFKSLIPCCKNKTRKRKRQHVYTTRSSKSEIISIGRNPLPSTVSTNRDIQMNDRLKFKITECSANCQTVQLQYGIQTEEQTEDMYNLEGGLQVEKHIANRNGANNIEMPTKFSYLNVANSTVQTTSQTTNQSFYLNVDDDVIGLKNVSKDENNGYHQTTEQTKL